MKALRIAISFDLVSDFGPSDGPDDLLAEYDSERTITQISEALESGGYTVSLIGGGKRMVRALLDDPPDLVFNIAEGSGGRSREAHAAGVFELLGIPYTHSDPLTLATSLDKAVAKRLVSGAGVATPRGVVYEHEIPSLDGLCFPLIAKPVAEGSSMGIRNASRIDDETQLAAVVKQLQADYDQPVLVEEFLTGPEITVGIVGTGVEASAIGAMEIAPIDCEASEFIYSIEVKREWESAVRYHVPSRVAEQEAINVAVAAYRALGCRDIGRVDLRLDGESRVHFIELNPLPGLARGYGDIVILADRCGIGYDQLILGIVDRARRRWLI